MMETAVVPEMSWKETIANILFGPKAEAGPDSEAGSDRESVLEEGAAEPRSGGFMGAARLELPPDHALFRLYDLRRRESGQLPPPCLSLDEDGVFPPEVIRQETDRLRSAVTSACGARLKEIQDAESSNRPANGEQAPEAPSNLDAAPCFFLSADKLCAWVMVLPPVGQGQELSRELLLRTMLDQDISFGVDEHLVDRLSQDERRYFHLLLIARGQPALDGENGEIVDYFPRSIARLLEADEYGQVDYTNLHLIRNVKQGQEICRLVPPTEGIPGRTVLDQEIPARSGRPVSLPKGRNTEIGEDGLTLIASMAGHVEFTGRSFQVKPVLDIQGNVDFSTGDINFIGDINIGGDVLSGFTLRAMGNIHVGGVIESGSSVEAGGDLVVVKGILGGGTAVVRSQRSIFSKYIENATIYVRENLQTDCIINGSVYCDGEVIVRSGRGCIMGGRIWASKMVSAQTVGSQSEIRTSIALGGLPCTNFEREVSQKELESLVIELEKLECQPDSAVRSSLLGKTRMKLSVAELKLKQLEEDLAELKLTPDEVESGRLECSIAHPGTEVSFGDEILRLRQEAHQCVVKMVCGEIVLT